MSLKSKILLILSAVVAMYALADHLLQRWILTPSFESLEEAEAAMNLQRTLDAIEREVAFLGQRCESLASWDETYLFLEDRNPAFVACNLSQEILQREDFDLVYLVALDGTVVHANVRARDGSPAPRLREFPTGAFAPQHPLLSPSDVLRPVEGMMVTELGPLLLSSRPVLPSDGQGSARGRLVLGRAFDHELEQEIGAHTRVQFTIKPLEPESLSERELGLFDRITAASAPVIEPRDEDLLHIYTTLPDIKAAPALLVRADIPRLISQRGASAIRYALLSTIAAGLLMMMVLLRLLQQAVLDPIATLTRHAVAIGRSDDTSVKTALDRADEIGVLSREFDAMLDKLADSRAQLVRTARSAGMSEIATGVLHNIGNVLNSVNVSVAMLGDKLAASRCSLLQRLSSVLEQHKGDMGRYVTEDPQGRALVPFVGTLSKQLAGENEALRGEVRSLAQGVDHIRSLVASQQAYAGKSGLREATRLAELIDAAVAMTAPTTPENAPLELVREYAELPAVSVDRHKLLEILVNLLQNARQAVAATDTGAGRIVLRLSLGPQGAQRIEVLDTGVGIPAENLVRIFNHGFTTKKNGHGFGLHSSANSAGEIGASLRAHSDGLGRGAAFTIDLPAPVALAA